MNPKFTTSSVRTASILKCSVRFLAPPRMVAVDAANNPIGLFFSAVICEMTVCVRCLSSFNQSNKEAMDFKELRKGWDENNSPAHVNEQFAKAYASDGKQPLLVQKTSKMTSSSKPFVRKENHRTRRCGDVWHHLCGSTLLCQANGLGSRGSGGTHRKSEKQTMW